MIDKCIVYDIEIVKAILGKNEERIEGIDYCLGWNDHIGMGVSVCCAYDYGEQQYRVFCGDNISDFGQLLAERDIWVTFNGVHFDDKVLAAVYGWDMAEKDGLPLRYDLKRVITRAHGVDPDKGYIPYLNMNSCCIANNLQVKSGSGAMAPVQWQRGEIGSVIDYCLNDVKMTKQLFDLIIQEGELISPRTKKVVKVERPWKEGEE